MVEQDLIPRLLYPPELCGQADGVSEALLQVLDARRTGNNAVEVSLAQERGLHVLLHTPAELLLPGLLSAIAERGNASSDLAIGPDIPMLPEAIGILEGLMAEFGGDPLRQKIADYNNRRKQLVEDGAPEFLIVTGINGCGKTTTIKLLRHAINSLGMEVMESKFPRRDSPVGAFILESLRSGFTMSSGANQIMFLADMADWLGGLEKVRSLILSDRLPPVDAMIYSQGWGLALSVSMLTQLEHILNVVILDRSPVASFESVKRRSIKPRALESSAELLALAQLKIYQVFSNMAGARILSVDRVDGITPNLYLKLIDQALIQTGILPRHYMRQRLSPAMAQEKADDAIWALFNDIKRPGVMEEILSN